MTVPYRPYSGTAGEAFIDAWCGRCKRDAEYRAGGESCPIVAATFVFPVTSPEYPKEWVKEENDATDETARCTAFWPED